MGASIIGHPCPRYIWLTWRWARTPEFPGRVLRLFDTGVREETRLIEELKGIGAEVWERDPQTGDQWRVSACSGHFGGSMDGVAKGLPEAPKTPAVLEFKTHSHKSFTDLINKQVRQSKPQHFDQMTVYMGLMELDRALYMAVDKDTDDIYTEWVHFDEERFQQIMAKAQLLIDSAEPPEKISNDPSFWQCKFCNFHALCHGGIAAEANCRTCCHSTPAAEGQWLCNVKGNKSLSHQEQLTGCSMHLMMPPLVPYAEPIDGGQAWVMYRHRETGVEFINGQGNDLGDFPVFSSKDLQNCPASLIGVVAETKAEFGNNVKVTSGSVDPMAGLVGDDPDKIPVKAESPAKKKERKKITAAAEYMLASKG